VSYALYPNGDQRYTAVLYVLIPVALVLAVSSEIADRLGQRTPIAANASSSTMNAPILESESVSHR
jgi:hypothetical protein